MEIGRELLNSLFPLKKGRMKRGNIKIIESEKNNLNENFRF